MQYNFCTLFDQNYLTRGLSLHQSLLRYAGDFKLWILCMDDVTYDILHKLDLEKVTLIQLTELEDKELLNIKPTRTAVEYCWTLTPSLPLYVLKTNPELKDIAYLDADTFFYSSPQPIYNEFVDHDALIVKHNYSPQFSHKEKESGTYNVELLIFRNNANGNRILQWWRDRCIEWCFFRYEDGKLGDQLYLNDWTDRFTGVRVLQHIGGGVAPWNVDKYDLHTSKGQLMVDDVPVIFYHFHAFRWYYESHLKGIHTFEPAENYWFPWSIKHYIYRPYLRTLRKSLQRIRSVVPGFSKGFHEYPQRTRSQWFEYIIHTVQSHQFMLYMLMSGIFMVVINNWLWPTSDEFLYGLIAKAFLAASQGALLWPDINTEHVAIVPLASYLWNLVVEPTNLQLSRLVMLPFSLGTVALLYGIGKAAKLDRKYWMWSLWLLLLIPGFWVFSVRLMLDVPAAFGITLLVYLLIKRAPSYQIGFAFLLLLLLKEYYVYILSVLVVCTLVLDALLYPTTRTPIKRGLLLLANLIIVFLPTLVTIIILLDFNYFPYPRLLETSLLFILGDLFTGFNKYILLLVGHTASSITALSANDIAQTAVVTTTKYGTSLVEVAGDLQYSGSIGEGVTESTAQYPAQNIVTRLWWIYKYNLSDVDVTLLILPLAFIGIWERIKSIYTHIRKHYILVRADIIMLVLFGLFAYFNYHEADNRHGFRITLAIIAVLIYFAVHGLRAITEHYSRKRTIGFGILIAIMLLAYWFSVKDITYGSVLSQNSLLSTLFAYKNYGFMLGYAVMAVVLVLFPRIKFYYKYWVLVLVVILFFASKFLPFYLDNKLSLDTYGYYYGTYDAAPLLQNIRDEDGRIYSNFHGYKVQYLADDPRIPNDAIFPQIRSFQNTYPERYLRFALDDTFMNSIATLGIQYVFIVNDKYNESELTTFREIQSNNPGMFETMQEQYKGDRLQWGLYKVVTIPAAM